MDRHGDVHALLRSLLTHARDELALPFCTGIGWTLRSLLASSPLRAAEASTSYVHLSLHDVHHQAQSVRIPLAATDRAEICQFLIVRL